MEKYKLFKVPAASCICGNEKYCSYSLGGIGCRIGNLDSSNVIIDMSERNFVSSDFCKNLITSFIQKNKKIYMINCSGQPKQVFSILNIDKYIVFCNDLNDAINKIEVEKGGSNL